MAFAAVILFYLGALITDFARYAGTCTQGDAGQLQLIVVALPVYAAALFSLTQSRSFGLVLVLCFPVMLVLFWQAWFAVEFAVRVLGNGASACDVLQGPPYGYFKDGAETSDAVVWLITGLGVPGTLLWVTWRRYAQAIPPTGKR